MKKSVFAPKKLKLSRETLRELEGNLVKDARGGVASVRHCTVPFTDWPTCDPIT